MAEPLRKEDELTTADLVGRSEKPQLVKNPRQDDVQAAVDENRGDFGGDSRTAVAENERAGVAESTPLFSDSEVGEFRSRWSNVQAGFVDEPRRAVEDADGLVAQLMKKLAEGFANERQRLEKHWDSGENVSTEDLRIALQRYRSFFDRLLKA
jgi:hypothetical protein